MKYGGSAAFLYEPLNSGPLRTPMNFVNLCLWLFAPFHMYSHVLFTYAIRMECVNERIHLCTCIHMCPHVLFTRVGEAECVNGRVGKWALNLFLSFTCFTCSAEVGYIKWNAPINASR